VEDSKRGIYISKERQIERLEERVAILIEALEDISLINSKRGKSPRIRTALNALLRVRESK